jgi:hypothetical protein
MITGRISRMFPVALAAAAMAAGCLAPVAGARPVTTPGGAAWRIAGGA